jgi:hypothetical protein
VDIYIPNNIDLKAFYKSIKNKIIQNNFHEHYHPIAKIGEGAYSYVRIK